jgi:hypothetical protein
MDTQHEKAALTEKLNEIYEWASNQYQEIKENEDKVNNFMKEFESRGYGEVMDNAFKHFDRSNILYSYNTADPEVFKDPRLKEEYLKLSEADRKFFVTATKAYHMVGCPFDSTHGYGEHSERKLHDFIEAVKNWES